MNKINLNENYLFSSESVTIGHPDKICDQISDAILDAYISQDKNSRVACECLIAKNLLVIAGEITSNGNVDIKKIAIETLKSIGYTNKEYGFDIDACQIITSISKQSPDISMGVNKKENHEQGAGDQGLMFGYACNETESFMPLPIDLAHKLTQKLTYLRESKILPWLRPDGKAQVTVKYLNGNPTEVTHVIVSTQHNPEISQDFIKKEIKEKLIYPICEKYLTKDTKFFINPTGSFVIGGPEGDTGLTGRKIIVDTYGGAGRHGGGCFSGKDPSKVDRSAAYMARHIAKNIIAAKIAAKCEVQIAYSIGIAEPVSIYINTFGTNLINNIDDNFIESAVKEIFPLRPADIIEYLNLKTPIYKQTAKFGHFGESTKNLSWEQINKIDDLRKMLNKQQTNKIYIPNRLKQVF
ncbi:methionine adenosyltransferase [Candidatus Dependentiae bacterium]|nr:methionine adenosyltransferase [Candidatus Dependentiae bacterium]MBU4387033.1 methionine adenosyltransferase [Candidatus Dependentiae bacterium]MCG2756699.1 methionine adenosyltransferase [Candidatus Dependentiae bacterium]